MDLFLTILAFYAVCGVLTLFLLIITEIIGAAQGGPEYAAYMRKHLAPQGETRKAFPLKAAALMGLVWPLILNGMFKAFREGKTFFHYTTERRAEMQERKKKLLAELDGTIAGDILKGRWIVMKMGVQVRAPLINGTPVLTHTLIPVSDEGMFLACRVHPLQQSSTGFVPMFPTPLLEKDARTLCEKDDEWVEWASGKPRPDLEKWWEDGIAKWHDVPDTLRWKETK